MTHSRLPPAAFLIVFLQMFLSAAAAPGASIVAEIPDDLLPAWEKVLSAAPLPAGVEIKALHDSHELSADTIVLTWRDRIGEDFPAGFRWKTVERVFSAPASALCDERESIAAGAASSSGLQVLPLERIELPSVGLAVDGLYADQPDYPFCRETVLGLYTEDPRLLAWFDSVQEASDDPILWIGAVGDVMPARGVDRILIGSGASTASDGLDAVFGDTLSILQSCDILLGNLEAAATHADSRVKKSYNFRFNPNALGALKNAGFSFFSIANNHSFDFGVQGFLDTLKNLAAFGIGVSGSGKDFDEALRPVQEARRGLEVRILSFAAYPREANGFNGRRVTQAGRGKPGVLWLDSDTMKDASRAFSKDSFDIAMVHGGAEYTETPTEEQRLLYRGLLEAGADLVIGSHPHVLQGLEAHSGGLIAYSLGNFIFPGMEEIPGGTGSVILLVGVYKGKIRYVREIPVQLSGPKVRVDPKGEPGRKLRELTLQLESAP